MWKFIIKIASLKIASILGQWLVLGGILIVHSNDLSGQTQKEVYTDSLHHAIKQATKLEKVRLYMDLLSPKNNPLPNREKISQAAIAFAQQIGDKELVAYANLHSSLTLINQGFHSDANKRLNIAYDYYASLPTNKLVVTTLILQGYNEHRQLFMTDALKIYLKALPLAKEINDVKRINNLYNRISNIYATRADYDKAFYYAKLVLKTCEQVPEPCPFLYPILESLGKLYLKIGEIDSARYFIEAYFEEVNYKNATENKEVSYMRMSELKIAEGDLEGAIPYADTALLIAKELDRRRGVIASHKQLAHIFEKKENTTKQLYHLQQQAALSNQYGFYFIEKEALSSLWKFYEQRKDFENANEIGKKWRSASDSLTAVERINIIKRQDELVEQYQQKEKIQLLENQNIKKGTNNTLLMIFAGFLLSILGLTIYFLRTRRQLNTRLKQKNQLLNTAVEERNTLLKEIHHRVKNNLQIISSLLNLQMRHLTNEEAKSALAEGRNRVRSIALIHQNLYQDMNFKEIQAEKYIKSLLSNIQSTFRNKTIEIELDIEAMLLEEDIMTQLGLVINEAVTNAYKHAFVAGQSGKIKLRFIKLATTLLLEIKDNGKGLPTDFNLDKSPTFGLQLIQDFSTRLKAKFHLESTDTGTLLALEIPMMKHENK